MGSINLKVTWVVNCVPFSRSLTFFNGGSYFIVSPNPANDHFTVTAVDKSVFSLLNANDEVIKFNPQIDDIEVVDFNGKPVFSRTDVKSSEVTVSLDRTFKGMHYIKIRSHDLIIPLNVLKI